MTISSFKNLQVWQKGIDLVDSVYQATDALPQCELYGLTSQFRRCAVSIPSNTAEGSQRKTDKDFANFVLIAKGSSAELHTQISIAKRGNFISKEQEENILNQIDELNKMLYALHSRLTAEC